MFPGRGKIPVCVFVLVRDDNALGPRVSNREPRQESPGTSASRAVLDSRMQCPDCSETR